jgi:hypothetical protein
LARRVNAFSEFEILASVQILIKLTLAAPLIRASTKRLVDVVLHTQRVRRARGGFFRYNMHLLSAIREKALISPPKCG